MIDTRGSAVPSAVLAEDKEEPEETPLSEGLVTLSSLPKSRWSNLLNLDIIKQRNKPTEPPKQPKKAPFFLPTVPGLEPKFIPAADDEDIPSVETGGSRILNLGKLQPLSEFQKRLEQCASTKKCKLALSLSLSLSFSHSFTLSRVSFRGGAGGSIRPPLEAGCPPLERPTSHILILNYI